MKIFTRLVLALMIVQGLACHPARNIKKQSPDFLERPMRTKPEQFDQILSNRDSFKVQIIYTQIDRDKNNRPQFTNYYFNLKAGNYYYPASTVKLPTALLALEQLNKLEVHGLNGRSSMITEASFSKQTPVYNDPTSQDGRPSIEQYIKKIFLVSDNDAFNRLYELLGQETINSKLHKKGYRKTDILHRLSIFMSEEENRHTNPVSFYDENTRLLLKSEMQYNKRPYPKRTDLVGKGYYSGGKLIERPMDFSRKNKLPLGELHAMMRAALFPSSVKKENRFNLTESQYRFVWQYLSQYPAESAFPPYDTVNYWDAYGKFLYWGGEKGLLPKDFRNFSKEGDAYGFLVDAAYIVDFDKRIEFMLSAVIYCNRDGILNDDQYDYDAIGKPFMKNLGRLIYEYEIKRPRTNLPDLSTFRLDYKN